MAGAPYSYETMQNAEDAGRTSFRIRDSADNRVATCYLESNARTIVQALNYEADHSGVEWVLRSPRNRHVFRVSPRAGRQGGHVAGRIRSCARHVGAYVGQVR